MRSLYHLLLLCASCTAALISTRSHAATIPAAAQDGPSTVETTYQGYGLDGLKVHPINSTVFDWWYFDAVSADSLASITIVFLADSPTAFPANINGSTVLDAAISGSFANGTTFYLNTYPAKAEITSASYGSHGQWGSGRGWTGSADAKTLEIYYDSEDVGVKGSMCLESIAPPHLPCGPVKQGAIEQQMPHVGWAKVVPDAIAHVEFKIEGESLQFSGPGYHDKNWGDQPWLASINSSYWGHSRLGPYSVVWADARDPEGKEYFSGYVAEGGKILSASCVLNSVMVRPWGGDSTYPPVLGQGDPKGFEVTFSVEDHVMRINVTSSLVVAGDPGVYTRFIGSSRGGFVGGEVFEGVALFEEFKV